MLLKKYIYIFCSFFKDVEEFHDPLTTCLFFTQSKNIALKYSFYVYLLV